MPELFKCPFCGNETPHLIESKIVSGIYSVSCKCGASMSIGRDEYGFSKQEAIDAWNKRGGI